MPNKYLKRIHLFFEAINRKIKDLHDFHIVLIVIALGLLIRFIHWVYFGSKVISFPVGVDNTLYASALRDHYISKL
jgi:cyanate permease